MRTYPIPTGYLFTDEYKKGNLETLSIGDYGKHRNVKADFLGYTDELSGVENGWCMPLSEKWVITLSTQFGCTQKCNFCDVPNVKFRGNASFADLRQQFSSALSLFPGVSYTERLNLHYARMGEPIFNENVFDFTEWLYENKKDLPVRVEVLHPVLTTSLPRKFKQLEARLMRWVGIKNNLYNGQAGLQFSINSTSEKQRDEMFGESQLTLAEFARIAEKFPNPIGRKYCLNFAYASDFEVDGNRLRSLFDPAKFMCKITPIHNNNTCRENGIETIDGYSSYRPYQKPEESLKAAGFDVLVFVPSMDEEDGLVTCGNAVLGGGKFGQTEDIIKIHGLPKILAAE